MSVLSAMQSASVRLLGRRPDSFFGAPAGRVFELELTDLVNEVAQDIAKYHDWQRLTKLAQIAADGSTTTFDMPDDYDRMLVRSEVQDSASWFWGYTHVNDINDFMYLQERGVGITPGAWIIYGDEIRFTPAPTQSAQFPYLSKNIVRDSGSQATKSDFTADTDEFLLPERLLTLGLVWRWRENKKLDFSGDQEAFMKALSEYAGRDKGSRAYRRSSRNSFPGSYPAWPWTLGGV